MDGLELLDESKNMIGIDPIIPPSIGIYKEVTVSRYRALQVVFPIAAVKPFPV